jgi:hypothetical protein
MENYRTVDTIPRVSLEGLYHPAEETADSRWQTAADSSRDTQKQKESKHDTPND